MRRKLGKLLHHGMSGHPKDKCAKGRYHSEGSVACKNRRLPHRENISLDIILKALIPEEHITRESN